MTEPSGVGLTKVTDAERAIFDAAVSDLSDTIDVLHTGPNGTNGLLHGIDALDEEAKQIEASLPPS